MAIQLKRYIMNNKALLISLLISAVSVSACAEEQVQVVERGSSKLPEKHLIPPPNELNKGSKHVQQWHKGTLQFINLEGGFYGFIGDKGERLLPLNLDVKYRQHGAVLNIYGFVDNDIMTIQQWGKPFRVLKVEVIEEGAKQPPANDI